MSQLPIYSEESFAPVVRRGIPFDFPPGSVNLRERLRWAILFDNGKWVDDSAYLPWNLGGDAAYVAVLYKDDYNRTRRIRGYSHVGYRPDRQTWTGMDDTDLEIRTARGDAMVGLIQGLGLEDGEFRELYRQSTMHPQFQEIAPDFRQEHYEWVMIQGLVDQEYPADIANRYREQNDPEGQRLRRQKELAQQDTDNYDGARGRYPIPEDSLLP